MQNKNKHLLLQEFKTLKPYFLQYRFKYLAGFICLFTVDAAQLLIPQFTKNAINIISQGQFVWRSVFVYCLYMVGSMAVISAGRFLWRYFIHGSSRRIEASLRKNLFDHLISLSWDFYQKNKIGDLIARSTNDIGAVRMSIGWGFVAGIDGTVLALSILIIIFVQTPSVAIFAVIPLPFITLLIIQFGKAVGKRFERAQQAYSTLSETVQETFAGIRVIKSFVKESWFIKKFAENNDDYREANMSVVKIHGFFMPLITFLSGFTSLIVILAGGRRVVLGLMSPGELVALFSYVQMLVWPMLGAGFTVNIVQRGAVSLKRINEVFNTQPSIKNSEELISGGLGAQPPEEGGSTQRSAGGGGDFPPNNHYIIEFRNLSFAYEDKPVLGNITLSIKEGEWLGILGRTGAGKSTLIKILPRLLDPPASTVFIKGIDIKNWNLTELRRLFGISPQDSFMFSDSIKNNILYGDDENKNVLSLNEILELSVLQKDLENFVKREETIIGERGVTLSGGQKQRLAIARAAISNPEILILDDSLSAVDAETEKKMLVMLEEERKGKTTLIISHRVSAFNKTDKVAVLESGHLIEYGTPAELMANCGYYAKTAMLQQLAQ